MFSVEGDEVRIHPPRFTLDTIWGSVPALPDRVPTDFEDEIEEAMEEAAERRMNKLRGS